MWTFFNRQNFHTQNSSPDSGSKVVTTRKLRRDLKGHPVAGSDVYPGPQFMYPFT